MSAMEVTSTQAYPRQLSPSLPATTPVTLVGRKTGLSEPERKFTLDIDPEKHDSKVEVILPEQTDPSKLRNVIFIEVRGTLVSEGILQMHSFTDLRQNFDLKTYNDVLRIVKSSEFKRMFEGE